MIPTLRTARLVLRPFRERDLDAFAAISADPEVMRHIGAGGPMDRAATWRSMALFLGHWALRGHGMWALEHGGRFIGRVGFLEPEGWPGCELGWLLAREAWGQGFAFEAASAARAWGREAAGLGALISLVRPDNLRSVALAERLGCQAGAPVEFLGGPALVFRHPDG